MLTSTGDHPCVDDMDKFKQVPFILRFDKRDAELMLKGYDGNDDRWYIKIHDNQILFNRTMSGECIFKTPFILDDQGLIITDAFLNRDPEIYTATDDRRDLTDIHYMILSNLLKKPVSAVIFEQRAIPLDLSKAHAYRLLGIARWGSNTNIKITEQHFRNQVFFDRGNFYLITDKTPDPQKFEFFWYDRIRRIGREGQWKDIWGHITTHVRWELRDEVFAFDPELNDY